MNLLRAGRALLAVLSGQLAVQAVMTLVGFAIVRGVSVQEFALYTLALSCVSLATTLADGGLGSATLALAGPQAHDPARLGRIIATARAWRLRLAAFSILLGVGCFLFLAWRLAVPWPGLLATALVMVPMALVHVLAQLSETPLRARGVVGWLQGLHFRAALARALASALVLLLLPASWLLLLASTLAQTWHLRRVQRRCADEGMAEGAPDPALAPHFRHALARAMPGVIYFCVSGQLAVVLIALFGNTTAVASLGALGRFGIVYSVLAATLGFLFTPWIARRAGAGIRPAYLLALGAFGGLVVATLGAAFLLRAPLLALLGPEYAGLEHEFLLLMLTGAIATVGGAAHQLAAARNVYPPPYSSVASCVVVQILAILSQDIATLSGVIWMTVIVNLWTLLLSAGYFLLCPAPPPKAR